MVTLFVLWRCPKHGNRRKKRTVFSREYFASVMRLRGLPKKSIGTEFSDLWVQPCRKLPLLMVHSSSFGSSLFSEMWRLIAAHDSAVKASHRTNRSTITPLFFMRGCTRLSCFLLAIVIILNGYVINNWCKNKLLLWIIVFWRVKWKKVKVFMMVPVCSFAHSFTNSWA